MPYVSYKRTMHRILGRRATHTRNRRTVRRANKTTRIVIDATLGLALVAMMSTALVHEVPHEYLGIATFALLIAHITCNRRWFASIAHGRYGARRVFELLSILGVLVCMVGLMASSLVLSRHALWFLPALPGLGWARRAHMLCSYWGFVCAFAHAGLEFGRVLPHKVPLPMRVAAIAFACFGAVSFVQIDYPAYLAGQVFFAHVDHSAPLAYTFARHASVATLIAMVAHMTGYLVPRGTNDRVPCATPTRRR